LPPKKTAPTVTYGKDQAEEMRLAAQQKRQPICIYCRHPLDNLTQTQYQFIYWTWNPKTKTYDKDDSQGDADKAYHKCEVCGCETKDWDFVDQNLVSY
jgi:hypothetical protein